MGMYELQKQVNGDQWAKGKQFYALDDDDAEKKAAEWVSFQRLYYGEKKVKIIKTVFEGNVRQLSYPIDDDNDYIEIMGLKTAEEAKMHLISEDSEGKES